MFATKDMAKPQQGQCKGRNVVAVRLVNVQCTHQRAMAAVKAVMSAMHVSLNALITVSLFVHQTFEHKNVY